MRYVVYDILCFPLTSRLSLLRERRQRKKRVGGENDAVRPRHAGDEVAMREQPRILIVEDDTELRDSLVERLSHGFVPLPAGNAKEMFEQLDRNDPVDVILLDILLPEMDGLSLCRELRRDGSPHADIPVIMVSALGDPTDRVAGLHAGADDYISKPFFTAELIARIHAVLRRAAPSASRPVAPDRKTRLRFGEWELDRKTRQLKNDAGLVVVLTPGDLRLLSCFLDNPHKILSRETILGHIDAGDVAQNNLSVKIRRLRAKLGENSRNVSYIRSFRNEGYMWDMPIKEAGDD